MKKDKKVTISVLTLAIISLMPSNANVTQVKASEIKKGITDEVSNDGDIYKYSQIIDGIQYDYVETIFGDRISSLIYKNIDGIRSLYQKVDSKVIDCMILSNTFDYDNIYTSS